jgi:hypothetical protein
MYRFSCLKSPCKIPPLPSPKRLRAGRQPPFAKGRREGFPLLTKGDEGGLDQFFKVLKCYQMTNYKSQPQMPPLTLLFSPRERDGGRGKLKSPNAIFTR